MWLTSNLTSKLNFKLSSPVRHAGTSERRVGLCDCPGGGPSAYGGSRGGGGATDRRVSAAEPRQHLVGFRDGPGGSSEAVLRCGQGGGRGAPSAGEPCRQTAGALEHDVRPAPGHPPVDLGFVDVLAWRAPGPTHRLHPPRESSWMDAPGPWPGAGMGGCTGGRTYGWMRGRARAGGVGVSLPGALRDA